jgi:hypothetical protein
MIQKDQFINIQISTLKLMLLTLLKKLESRKDWVAPLGILISLLLSLAASEFKNFAGLSGENWQGIVITLSAFSFIWLAYSLYQAYNSITIDDFIDQLNDSSSEIEDCRVLFFIKNKDVNGIWHLLVMHCPVYKCDMLPYTRKGDGVPDSVDLKFILSQKLKTPENNVLLEHMNGLSIRTIKQNLYLGGRDHFLFEFNLVKFVREEEVSLLHKSFELDGIEYNWRTIDELISDDESMKKNGDVVLHIRDNFAYFFSDEKARSLSSALS